MPAFLYPVMPKEKQTVANKMGYVISKRQRL